MPDPNHTPIHHIIAKHLGPSDDPQQSQNTTFTTHPSKESEPRPASDAEWHLQEVVEQEGVDEEIKAHVEVAKAPEIPPDIENLGVQKTDSVTFPTTRPVKLPLADDKVMIGLHAPVTSSFRWLATLAILILRQAHMTLKTVHGKTTRVEMR